MITLYEFDASPYCAKVRKLMDYKKLAYEKVEVNYLSRAEPKALSGQGKVPVIKDGERVVNDSTTIALYLEERYPDPPALPADPAERARALLIEDWVDEKLAIASLVKMLVPGNAEAVVRGALAKGAIPGPLRLVAPIAPAFLRNVIYGRKRKGRSVERILADFGAELDRIAALLAASPFVMGSTPTIPDFGIYGFLVTMEGLTGFEAVRERPALSAWYDRVKAL